MGLIQIFILILVVHFLADFAMQTDEQAKGKSVSLKWLSYHVGVYTLIWILFWFILPINPEANTLENFLGYSVFIFITHWVTDFFTSRIGKPFWEKGDNHFGFVVVGLDQIIHYLTLLWLFTQTNILIIK